MCALAGDARESQFKFPSMTFFVVLFQAAAEAWLTMQQEDPHFNKQRDLPTSLFPTILLYHQLSCLDLQATVEAWLTMQHGDPHFNATFGPWLATLPKRGEILTADGMSPAEVAMIQGGPLVRERSRNN